MTRRPRPGFEGAGGNPELVRPTLVNASQAASLVRRQVGHFLLQRGFEFYSDPQLDGLRFEF